MGIGPMAGPGGELRLAIAGYRYHDLTPASFAMTAQSDRAASPAQSTKYPTTSRPDVYPQRCCAIIFSNGMFSIATDFIVFRGRIENHSDLLAFRCARERSKTLPVSRERSSNGPGAFARRPSRAGSGLGYVGPLLSPEDIVDQVNDIRVS
jgi:hypothetical protein